MTFGTICIFFQFYFIYTFTPHCGDTFQVHYYIKQTITVQDLQAI